MNFLKTKAEGSAILITMVMGAVMLSLGLTALSMVISDAKVAWDFVLSERAYFAAESGMEEALLQLKQNPVENIQDHEIALDESIGQTASVSIGNLVPEFSFSLPPFRSKKFRLKRETPDNNTETTDYDLPDQFTFADRFKIYAEDEAGSSSGDSLHWKIVCSQSFENDTRPTRTVSLQASEPISTFNSGVDAESLIGNWDTFEIRALADGTQYYTSVTNPSGIQSSADSFLSQADLDGQSCFYSLTNNSSSSTLLIKIIDTSPNEEGLSPYQTKIVSKGASGAREKTIEFNYVQKNLGELFDFVFFHTGN